MMLEDDCERSVKGLVTSCWRPFWRKQVWQAAWKPGVAQHAIQLSHSIRAQLLLSKPEGH